METFAPTLMQRTRLFVTGHPIHALSAVAPVLSYYGGATVTRAHDATGALFTVCCAKNLQLNAFGLYSLKDGIAQWIAPVVSGRGSIWISLFDGHAYWVGWDGNTPPQGGAIPDFVPIRLGNDTSALEAEIDALQQQVAALDALIASLPPTTTGPIVKIPARNSVDGAMLYLLAAQGDPYLFDVAASGILRLSRGGVVLDRWPK